MREKAQEGGRRHHREMQHARVRGGLHHREPPLRPVPKPLGHRAGLGRIERRFGRAVAAFMCPAAVGTDTGGSIRGPASACGTMGLKPTYGRVSLRGIFPNSPSLDHAGPLARTARDCGLMLQAMAGYDPADAGSEDRETPDFCALIGQGIEGMRFGLCEDLHLSENDESVQKVLSRR